MIRILIIFTIILLVKELDSQGLIFDKEAFLSGKGIERTRNTRIYSDYSLKNYAPYVLTQDKANCVAYSLASARTILFAKELGITSKDTISALMFSPHWIYYRNKESNDLDCMQGLNLEKACIDVLNNGVAPMIVVEYSEYYPWSDLGLCNTYPGDYHEDLELASNFSLSDVYRLKSIDDIKFAISNDLPVITGMAIPESFMESRFTRLWTPSTNEEPDDGFLHAMVIVSYSDFLYGGAFEIMNSWGETWGTGGFIWVRYDDFINFALGAYALESVKPKFGSKPNLGISTDKFSKRKEIFRDSIIESQRYSKLLENWTPRK